MAGETNVSRMGNSRQQARQKDDQRVYYGMKDTLAMKLRALVHYRPAP